MELTHTTINHVLDVISGITFLILLTVVIRYMKD